MTCHIPKGWHYPLPPSTWLSRNKNEFAQEVTFYDSCRYDLGTVDQGDTNKLFGFAYLRSIYRPAGVKWWQLWNYQHGESARFGWRYIIETSMWELSAYCHVNRQSVIIPICSVPVRTGYITQIVIEDGHYIFRVYRNMYRVGGCSVAFTHGLKWQAQLGPYFGGNRKAPHRMKIRLWEIW